MCKKWFPWDHKEIKAGSSPAQGTRVCRIGLTMAEHIFGMGMTNMLSTYSLIICRIVD